MRAAALGLYGALSYAASLASFYVIFGWLGGPVPVPVRLDQDGPPGAAPLVWNTAVMLGFAVYHSVYARSSVKVRVRRIVGRNLERATYNLLSAALAVALCLLWRSLPARLWTLPPAAAESMPIVHGLLWVVHLTSIVLMNHNDFFGLRQVGLAMRGQAYRPLPAISRGYYLATRLTLVVSLALIPWASAVMTIGRLQFCLFMTAYIALGAWLSNRDRGDVAATNDGSPRLLAARPRSAGAGRPSSSAATAPSPEAGCSP